LRFELLIDVAKMTIIRYTVTQHLLVFMTGLS